MTKLCLNSIVKNEGARIERMLDSVCQFIDYWVIVDTGSTDDTKEKIKAYFEYHKIPGELHEAPFHDWSQARNAALAHARHAWIKDPSRFDYLLLVDADMELKVFDRSCLDNLTGPSYDIMQHAGTVHYANRRLLKADQTGQYVGVTHEYLDVETAGLLPEDRIVFFDHADGANRPEKYKRDIRLLKAGLKAEPNNERYMFYLANSYRDAGDHVKALKWYERRIAAGGWDEEVWQAEVYAAHCKNELGDAGGFILGMLSAYNRRPTRAEPLYNLSRALRDTGKSAAAALFANVAADIPKPNDLLFVDDYVYNGGAKQELAITGFYSPTLREKAFHTNDALTLFPGPYPVTRHTARANMYWYLQPLSVSCPSFRWHRIKIPLDDGWTAMNPSVTTHMGRLECIVRTVNYKITEDGRYIIREVLDDGKTGCNANAEFPINTRNFLVGLTHDLLSPVTCREVLPPGNFPKRWPMVVGFEDMRLFSYRGRRMFSATVRQLHEDGNCEQVRGVINDDGTVGEDYVRMLRQPRVTEKNWAPWVPSGHDDFPVRFMYRPGIVVDGDGRDVEPGPINTRPFFDPSTICGGSQLIPWRGGYLALVHESAVLPMPPHKRYYWHRFIHYDHHGKPIAISTPFVFNDRVIEFAAGMCWHPDENRLVISYGYQDAEARIATVESRELEQFLCPVQK
jgi:tetratricopeptide (TPR) repeat protein